MLECTRLDGVFEYRGSGPVVEGWTKFFLAIMWKLSSLSNFSLAIDF